MTATRRTLDHWLQHIGRERPADVTRGLVPVAAVAHALGVARPAPQNVVIAGTNGKGSTAVFSESLLRAGGLRVGTTLSPHVFRFNERIRIDGRPVSDEIVCEALAAVDAARNGTVLSYFEYATLAALWVFARSRVDVAVLEVGLGGRLDAVNVVDGDVTVITSIGLDHQALLGNDRESIGGEKAGILRAGIPLVYGEADMPQRIAERAALLGVPVYQLDRDYNAVMGTEDWHCSGVDFSLPRLVLPHVAINNAATAVQAVRLLAPGLPWGAELVDAASRTAELPGRFQRRVARDRTFVLDVAHNPHAAAFLARQLRTQPVVGRTVAVAGFLRDKDVQGIVAALAPEITQWWFVDTEGERGQAAGEMARQAGEVSGAAVPALADAIAQAVAATAPGDRVLIAGSFDVVQRASALLQARERAA